MKKHLIHFNSPVILGMTILSFALLLVSMATQGMLNNALAVRYTGWGDPLMYIRLFTHVLVHQDLSHYTGNFLLILAVGPLVEEKYGSARLLVMVCATALATGLVNVLFSRSVMLLGASGIVFMLILLASFTNLREGSLPLTVLLVSVLYIGNEIAAGLIQNDNISRISHIVGGLCGAGFGFLLHRDNPPHRL